MIEPNENIEEFVKENLKFGDVQKSDNKYREYEKWFRLDCSCNKSNFLMESVECDEFGNLSKRSQDYIVGVFSWKLLNHIERKVKLRADDYHIKLLLKFYGENEGIKIIDKWAKQNMLVALKLKKIVEEFSNKLLEIKNE